MSEVIPQALVVAPLIIPGVTFGGVMHRFESDKAIRIYCENHGLSDPSISDTGAVYAVRLDFLPDNEEVQIGWVK